MGIDVQTAKFLLAAKRYWGVNFRSVLTIGRQQLYAQPEALRRLLGEFGISDAATLAKLEAACNGFAEPFLQYLGAEEVVSLDASPYEQAILIHDMNRPISAELAGRFDVVYDGGSLEHIFNFPVAVKNCMEMVHLGGYFIGASPANNWCGHGFYQFSPELYFRVLSEENGFRVERAVVYESAAEYWYEVEDPARVRQRVEILSALPVSLIVLAQRTAMAPVLRDTPQQSDYLMVWQGQQLAAAGEAGGEAPLKRLVKRGLGAIEQVSPAAKAWFGRIRRSRYRRSVMRQAMRGLQSPNLKPVVDLHSADAGQKKD
jgi:hypothetical protein